MTHIKPDSQLRREREVAQFGGREPSRPRPGLYGTRLVKGGPELPAAILYAPTRDPLTRMLLDRSYWWCLYVAGDLVEAEPVPGPRLTDVWCYGRLLTAAEYRLLLDRARDPDPLSPYRTPRQPIDLATVVLPF